MHKKKIMEIMPSNVPVCDFGMCHFKNSRFQLVMQCELLYVRSVDYRIASSSQRKRNMYCKDISGKQAIVRLLDTDEAVIAMMLNIDITGSNVHP